MIYDRFGIEMRGMLPSSEESRLFIGWMVRFQSNWEVYISVIQQYIEIVHSLEYWFYVFHMYFVDDNILRSIDD